MTSACKGSACFQALGDGRARVEGVLHFDTVASVLPAGEEAIAAGHATLIDLKDVTESDSAGLALLIEWLSYAKAAQQPLRYENVPGQMRALAHLSDIEDLLEAR